MSVGAPVLYDVSAGVAIITLNRPDRLNAWTDDLEALLYERFDDASADPNVRVIVLTGTRPGFCPGADFKFLQTFQDDTDGSQVAGIAAPERHLWEISKIPKPIIAAINGACAGVGLSLALTCDMRFAARGANFATAFARRGLVAEHGISWTLPRVVGQSRAADLLFSGRKFSADDALAYGLVHQVVEPDDLLPTVLAYAHELVRTSAPSSMAAIKAQLWADGEGSFQAAAVNSYARMAASLVTADFDEGIASFLEQRDPQFAPLVGELTTS